jgi:hypothetical protein
MTESLMPRLEGKEQTKAWIRRHLGYAEDWCLLWPFSRIQSGYATFGGKATAVHRLMCEYRNGLPPTPKHQACHSCGRGKEGCVNPKHLSWKTNAENQIERYQHSGPTKRAKLTPEQVQKIIDMKELSRIDDLAAEYGVTAYTIHRIHSGKLWRQTSSLTRRVFTEEEVLQIRSTIQGEKTSKKLAQEFGASCAAIDRIRRRKTYKWVPESAGALSELSRPQCPPDKKDL